MSCAWSVASSAIETYMRHNHRESLLEDMIDKAEINIPKSDGELDILGTSVILNRPVQWPDSLPEQVKYNVAKRKGKEALQRYYDHKQYDEYCDDCNLHGIKPMLFEDFMGLPLRHKVDSAVADLSDDPDYTYYYDQTKKRRIYVLLPTELSKPEASSDGPEEPRRNGPARRKRRTRPAARGRKPTRGSLPADE